MEVGGWNTAGGAVVVPATGAAADPAAPTQQPAFHARVAAHTGVGIVHISSDTLQAGVDMVYRGIVCANNLYLDLLQVAAQYIDVTQ